mgnify:CR=1 FL=1|tara:strand:- start:3771 stop:5330 length:1560 start_codon:yes stop_codon:yes gene_type:complete
MSKKKSRKSNKIERRVSRTVSFDEEDVLTDKCSKAALESVKNKLKEKYKKMYDTKACEARIKKIVNKERVEANDKCRKTLLQQVAKDERTLDDLKKKEEEVIKQKQQKIEKQKEEIIQLEKQLEDESSIRKEEEKQMKKEEDQYEYNIKLLKAKLLKAEEEYALLEQDAPTRKKVLEKAKVIMKELSDCRAQRERFFAKDNYKIKTRKIMKPREKLIKWWQKHKEDAILVDETSETIDLQNAYDKWNMVLDTTPKKKYIETILNMKDATFRSEFNDFRYNKWKKSFDEDGVEEITKIDISSKWIKQNKSWYNYVFGNNEPLLITREDRLESIYNVGIITPDMAKNILLKNMTNIQKVKFKKYFATEKFDKEINSQLDPQKKTKLYEDNEKIKKSVKNYWEKQHSTSKGFRNEPQADTERAKRRARRNMKQAKMAKLEEKYQLIFEPAGANGDSKEVKKATDCEKIKIYAKESKTSLKQAANTMGLDHKLKTCTQEENKCNKNAQKIAKIEKIINSKLKF